MNRANLEGFILMWNWGKGATVERYEDRGLLDFHREGKITKKDERVQVSKNRGVGTLNGKFFKYQNKEKSKGQSKVNHHKTIQEANMDINLFQHKLFKTKH